MYDTPDMSVAELEKLRMQMANGSTPSSPMAMLAALQMAQKMMPQQQQPQGHAVHVGGGNAASFKPMPFGMGLYSPQVLRRLYGR